MNYPELKIVSLVFMFVLLSWSLMWVVVAITRLRESTNNKLYWQIHIIWSIINLLIAGYSLISTAQQESFMTDRAIALRNFVIINIIFDVVYVLVAIALKRSSNSKKQDIGQAVLIQGTFLLLLDTVIVITFLAIMA